MFQNHLGFLAHALECVKNVFNFRKNNNLTNFVRT